MPDSALQSAANWTAANLYSVVNKAGEQAKAEGAKLAANTHAIAALKAKTDLIADMQVRARAQEAVSALSRRQAQHIVDYNGFVSQFKSIMAKVSAWLKGVGVTPPEFTLGLSALPLVPIAIGAGVVALLAFLATIALNNAAMSRSLNSLDVCRNSWLDGKISEAQYRQCADDISKTSKGSAPQNPFNLGLEQLLPIGLVVLGILVLPPIVKAMTSGKGGTFPIRGWR